MSRRPPAPGSVLRQMACALAATGSLAWASGAQGAAVQVNVVDAAGKPKEAQFVIEIPKGLSVTVEVPAARGESEPAKFTVAGPDKHLVGQFAANVRKLRPPEPYKGKGIRYLGEHVRRKQGKAFAGGGG